MTQSAEEIATQALELPESDRLGVAQRLWESCDLSTDVLEQIDNQIAARRAQALDSGEDPGVSGEDAFAQARAALQCD